MQKVVGLNPGLGQLATEKTLSTQQQMSIFFKSGKIRERKERDGLSL